ncbi:J domain-containing protein [Mesorhizobium sp. M1D.F.Ca.ET.184.01.1.1]|nr:J domain-containing protein [Mesorhizobium sp. M1D.F.Ca.ET.231.01.1.1]TGP24753.1 J domain-containing protein [Mesorhizobium sp. M1D.F.Ca.ET.234.01.1.1]TGS37356.1 J domain-containing protein [Mesorhizobium sp. M1D.F.Ca.ET.184.01.1.1]TGS58156.1 J domain-containing protein [Mesorhizobium sp. M1D.F.Ca.ET.183.01.1.1]
MDAQAFPLHWPSGRPRKLPGLRKNGKFSTAGRNGFQQHLTVAEALARLQSELDRIGARNRIISSNLETRLDGLPRSGQPDPSDPGVALYFHLQGKPHCMPCDTYTKTAQNIAAIAAHIEATRAIERHGVSSVAEMFTGFAALPPPGAKRPWRDVMDFQPLDDPQITRDVIESRYRRLAAQRHPDLPGGSHDAMAELNQAKEQALKEIGA